MRDDLIVHKHTDINIYAGCNPMTEEQKRDYGKKSSLEVTDQLAASVQKTPNRISLDHIKSIIAETDYFSPPRHPQMIICMLTLKNGWICMGKSAPADPLNFDETVGRTNAYEDAVRQIWPLEAYLLREQLSKKE